MNIIDQNRENQNAAKALDMVKHLTAAFNLPVFIAFIADGDAIKPGPLVKPDEK